MVIQGYISYKNGSEEEEYGSDIGNVIEWTYAVTIFLVFLSMGKDV